jgi:YVTN family beta-propeller protein
MIRFAVLPVLLAVSAAVGQYLEETIYLPDSLSGLIWPTCLEVDTVNGRVYAAGGDAGYNGWQDAYSPTWLIVVDAATSAKVARVRMPGQVTDMSFSPASNKLFCLHNDFSGPDDFLSVIDCARLRIVASVPVGEDPKALCYNATEDKVYSVNNDESTVTVVDCRADTVAATVTVPEGPEFLFYSPTGNKLYCWGRGREVGMWVAAIDGAGDTVLAVVGIGGEYSAERGFAVNPTTGRAYVVGDGRRGCVAVLDLAGDSLITTIPVGYAAEDLVYNPSNNRLYCSDVVDTVWVIDATADTILRTIEAPLDFCPGQLCFASQENKLYIASAADDRTFWQHLLVLDCATDSIIGEVPAGEWPYDIVYEPVHGRVYSVNNYDDNLSVVDCAADTALPTVDLGCKPQVLCYCPGIDKVYAACGERSNPRLMAVDCATNRVVASVPFPQDAWGLCYNPDMNRLYCTSLEDSIVAVLDCAVDSFVALVPVGPTPLWMCYVPGDRPRVYCGHVWYDRVAVLDCCGDSVVAQIPTGVEVRPICYNSENHKVYCGQAYGAGQDSFWIRVVDCHSDTLVESIHIPAEMMGYFPELNKVYVGDYDFAVYAIDGETDSVVATMDSLVGLVGTPAWGGLCFNDINMKAYMTTHYDGAHFVFYNPGGGGSLYDACYNRAGNRVYVACGASDFIVPIDGETNAVLPAVNVGHRPRALAWSPVRSRLYVCNYRSSSISVVKDTTKVGLDGGPSCRTAAKPSPTFVRQMLPADLRRRIVVDAVGRIVADLAPGETDVRHLAPGVFFVRQVGCHQTTKVVIAR